MTVRVALAANAGSGNGPGVSRSDILRALDSVGIATDSILVPPERFAEAVRDVASGYDAVVAAGGDGTVSAVAQGLVGLDTRLAVLPLGTLNHFARDLGIPLGLTEAARVVATGEVRAVDVVEVNGQVVVNNSSIGGYPIAVALRDDIRARTGTGKWRAMSLAAARVFARFPVVDVDLTIDGETMHVETPCLFVGNNSYAVDGLSLGERARLDGGVLCVCTVDDRSRRRWVLLALRALVGRASGDPSVTIVTARRVRVDTGVGEIPVSVDGESLVLRQPLDYRVRPGALKVLVPGTQGDQKIENGSLA